MTWARTERAGVAPAAGAAQAGVGRRRPRCRHAAEHARSGRRDAGDDLARRGLVVVLARLRRARACSTASARSSRSVFVTVDGYWYGGKVDCRLDKLRGRSLPRLPSSSRSSSCRISATADATAGAACRRRRAATTSWRRSRRRRRSTFARLPFDHPLYILYSSGTTGVPKCIVHGAGGTLLQHLKEHQLHCDIRAGDRALLLHDLRLDDVELAGRRRSPSARRCCSTTARRSRPAASILLDYAEAGAHDASSARRRSTSTPARRLASSRARTTTCSALRTMLSTGSPARAGELRLRLSRRSRPTCTRLDLRRHRHRLVLRARRSDAAGLARRDPVPRLGMAVDVCDEDGKPIARGKGELVCTRAVSLDAGRLLERSRRRQLPRRLFRALPRRLVPRRLRRVDRARRHRSSTAARTRRSIPAACASARRRSTGRSSS